MERKKLRIFFLPFFASGHMIPMADLAVLFSRYPHVDPTICLTPANADILRPHLPSNSSPPTVNVLHYPFPSEQCGLPPGQENLSSVSASDEWRIYKAVDLSRDAHERVLRENMPDVVVADVPFSWTTDIAEELGILKITWHAVGVFPQVVMNLLYNHHRNPTDDIITIKDLPGPQIQMPKNEVPEFVRSTNHMTEAWPSMKKAQLNGFGVIVNTCYTLETAYCDLYRATHCRRAWFVGPVALARDKTVSDNDNECIKWLDKKAEGSVLFVCFGSWCRFSADQLAELARGLEDSGRSFLWVVREGEIDESFKNRVSPRGTVVEGWAPQVAVLRHPAVGAFLTHCGWNSVLEAAAAGKPMLTWPLVFEQFINERLVVDVWKAGRRVFGGARGTQEEEKAVVPASAIADAVKGFMEGNAEEEKAVARRVRDVARAAVAAEEGCSWKDLDCLIDELMRIRNIK